MRSSECENNRLLSWVDFTEGVTPSDKLSSTTGAELGTRALSLRKMPKDATLDR